MPKCPKCGGDISTLNAYSVEENKQEVSLCGEALEWSTSEVVEGSCTKIEFECPTCQAKLFTTKGDSQPKEVIDFLKETV